MSLIATVYKERMLGNGSLPVVALEEQVQAIDEANALQQKIEGAFAANERAVPMTSALEDLAFVVDRIREVTPKEAALIQIAGDMAVAGTDQSADSITPAMESMNAKQIGKRIVDFLKQIYAKIKDFAVKAIEWFKKTFLSEEAKAEKSYEDINASLKKAEEQAQTPTKTAPKAEPAPKTTSITVPKSVIYDKDMTANQYMDAYAREQMEVMKAMAAYQHLWTSTNAFAYDIATKIHAFNSMSFSVFEIPSWDKPTIPESKSTVIREEDSFNIIAFTKDFPLTGVSIHFTYIDVKVKSADSAQTGLELLTSISRNLLYPKIVKLNDETGESIEVSYQSTDISKITIAADAMIRTAQKYSLDFKKCFDTFTTDATNNNAGLSRQVKEIISLAEQFEHALGEDEDDKEFFERGRKAAAALNSLSTSITSGTSTVGNGYRLLLGRFHAPTHQLARLFSKATGREHSFAEESYADEPVYVALEDMTGDAKIMGSDIVRKIKDTIDHIIAAIKALIKQVMTYASSYISRIVVIAGGSETRLKKLEKAFAELQPGAVKNPDNISIQLPTVGGKGISTMSDLIDESRKFSDAMKNFMGVVGDANYNYGSGFVRLYESDLAKSTDDNTGHRDGSVKLLGSIAHAFDAGTMFHRQSFSQLTGQDGSIIGQTSQLIGGVRIQVEHMDSNVFTSTTLHSSASVRELINRVAKKNSISVINDAVSTVAVVEIAPMTFKEIEQAIQTVKGLLAFYSSSSGNNSISASLKKRTQFAQSCANQIATAVKSFKVENPVAYAMLQESLTVTDSITKNATIPYVRLSEAAGRTISYLLVAISKSIAAYARVAAAEDGKSGTRTLSNNPSTTADLRR